LDAVVTGLRLIADLGDVFHTHSGGISRLGEHYRARLRPSFVQILACGPGFCHSVHRGLIGCGGFLGFVNLLDVGGLPGDGAKRVENFIDLDKVILRVFYQFGIAFRHRLPRGDHTLVPKVEQRVDH
jgi:hypothetical protein